MKPHQILLLVATLLASAEAWAGCGGMTGAVLEDCQRFEQKMLADMRNGAIAYLDSTDHTIVVSEVAGAHLCKVARHDGKFTTPRDASSRWGLGGGMRLEVQCQSGKVNGPARSLNEDGSVAVTAVYKDDRLHGPQKRYLKGKLAGEGQFLEGRKSGRWVEYFPDGKPEEVFQYRNDLLEGPSLRYFANGKVSRESTFKDGQPVGLETQWTEDGKKAWEIDHLPGGDTRRQYDAAGKLLDETTFEGGKRVVRRYKDGVPLESP